MIDFSSLGTSLTNEFSTKTKTLICKLPFWPFGKTTSFPMRNMNI